MSQTDFSTTYINTHQELYPYLLSETEGKSIRDLMAFYSPNGPIRKSVAYYGGAGVSQILSVNNSFYRINHVLKQMLGMPAYQSGLDTSMVAGGKGYKIPASFLAAMGESAERFFGMLAGFDEETEIAYGSYRQLEARGYTCLHPDEVPLFADEQYDQPTFLYDRFTEDTQLGWVEGTYLISGETVWVPAQLVLFFYASSQKETPIGYGVSCGLASHIDWATAIYGGITELVERDGMTVSWKCQIPPKRVVLDRPLADATAQRFASVLNTMPGQYACYLHELDLPELPVASVLERVPHLKKFGFYAGGAAGIDVDEAVTGALVEYGQSEAQLKLATFAPGRRWSLGTALYFDIPPDKPVEEMQTFLEHLGYYGYPENQDDLHTLMHEGDEVALSSFAGPPSYADSTARLEALKTKLGQYDIDPIVFDLTPPQFDQLRVVKVFMPQLALPHVASQPYLGHPRLYETPQKMGLTDRRLTFEELMHAPEPYP